MAVTGNQQPACAESPKNLGEWLSLVMDYLLAVKKLLLMNPK